MLRSHYKKSKKAVTLNRRRTTVVLVSVTLLVITTGSAVLLRPQLQVKPIMNQVETSLSTPIEPQPIESYKGTVIPIAGRFSVKIPNGWSASISQTPAFTGILFSKLDELGALTYQPDNAPVINEGTTPLWNGLTEHFFIMLPASSQRFSPSAHLEISSTAFTFDDGHIGTKYDVVKHAIEAKKWGGLKRDTEWQGRTYIYEVGDERIEAHLAVYPSSSTDIPFYEKVVRTIHQTE